MKLLFLKRSTCNFDEFSETNSVQVQGSVEDLHRLGRFFTHCAQVLEEYGDDFGHMHLQDFENRENLNTPDIIVFPENMKEI